METLLDNGRIPLYLRFILCFDSLKLLVPKYALKRIGSTFGMDFIRHFVYDLGKSECRDDSSRTPFSSVRAAIRSFSRFTSLDLASSRVLRWLYRLAFSGVLSQQMLVLLEED